MPDFKVAPTVNGVALLRANGTVALTADWDIGTTRRILSEGFRARSSAGLRLEDDAGNLGVLIEDNGLVVVGANGMQFRSSSIAHGMTNFVSTDTYAQIIPGTGTFGGLSIEAFTDTDGISPLGFNAVFGADPTDTLAAVQFVVQKKSGTGGQALAAAETAFAIDNFTTRLFTILGNGSSAHNRAAALTTTDMDLSASVFAPANFSVEAPAVASRSEVIQTWGVSDSTSFVALMNGSAVNSVFSPSLTFRDRSSSQARFQLISETLAANDTGTSPMLEILAFRRTNAEAYTAIATRPIFAIKNLTTAYFQISAAGNFGFGTADIEASDSTHYALQMGTGAQILYNKSAASDIYINDNAYFDGAWKRRISGLASFIGQNAGTINMSVAVTGAADSSITWKTGLFVDDSANVGFSTIDVEAGNSDYGLMQLGLYGMILYGRGGVGNNIHIAENLYYDGAWKYRSTGAGAAIFISATSGVQFHNVASGTIDTTATFVEAMRVLNDGRVGIGTGTPAATETNSRFTVQGSDGTAFYTAVINTGAGQVATVWNRTGTSPGRWLWYLPAGGNTFRLYGGSTPSDKITIAADGAVTIPYIGATVLAGTAVHTSAGGTLTKATSSKRYKRNIKPVDSKTALGWLRDLSPVSYRAKQHFVGSELVDYTDKEDSDEFVGLLAEDVYALSGTRFVGLDDGGKPESLHYDRLVAPLILGWQSHEQRIAKLEREIAELRKN